MNNFFIIILDPNTASTQLRAKIRELGDYYNIYNNQYLICIDCNNAQELYERLQQQGTPPVGIVIFGASVEHLTYWGHSDKGLWAWLKSHIHN